MGKIRHLAAAALLALASPALAQDKLYVPLISKGFQHQFWQAVKAGADKAEGVAAFAAKRKPVFPGT